MNRSKLGEQKRNDEDGRLNLQPSIDRSPIQHRASSILAQESRPTSREANNSQQGEGRASRVLLITNIPTPYRIPLFNELNTQLADEGISFKVIFAALGYARRKWDIDMAQCSFPWEVLNSGRVPSRNPESAVFTYSGLDRILRAEKDALIIVSGFSLATTRIWLRSLFRKTRYLIWSGAIHRKDRADPLLQRWQRRILISRARCFIAYGTRARDYMVSLGADPQRVSVGINTVDSDYFSREADRLRGSKYGDATKRILYVGNLERGKRLDLLLKAIRILAQSHGDFVLEIVGSGSQEVQLKQLTRDLGIEECVKFLGFLQRHEVAERLSKACCFAFPSEYDIWGLVLVEAMAAGVPCVSSVYAGATCDLIQDGVRGFALDFGDSGEVAAKLRWVLNHPEDAQRMGEDSKRFVLEEVSLAKSIAGFVEAIARASVSN